MAPWIALTSGVAPSMTRSCAGGAKPLIGAVKQKVRMEAMGASIANGVGSFDGTGFRGALHTDLGVEISDAAPFAAGGGSLDFVGRQGDAEGHVGGTPDPDNEGYPGFRIDQMLGPESCSVSHYRPNVVTLVAGTNDMVQNRDPANAPARLGGLVDKILADSPRATVLVSAIPPTTDPTDPGINARTSQYNEGVEAAMAARAAAGAHVLFVQPGLTAADVGDDDHIHPTDEGYQKMADAFLEAVNGAEDMGWLQEPEAMHDWPAGCQTATTASPVVDSRWEDHGVSFSQGFGQGNSYRLGDVNKDRKSELFVVDPQQGWKFYWNGGPSSKTAWNAWGPGPSRVPRKPGLVGNALRLGNLDSDGIVDCLAVSLDGHIPSARKWNNTAPVGQKLCGTASTKPNLDVPVTGAISPDTQIVFADLDGDGVDEYLLVKPDGTTTAWRYHDYTLNGSTRKWEPIGQIAGSLGKDRVVRWADINGDGRADEILLTLKGGARAWINDGGIPSGNSVPETAKPLLRDIGEIMSDKGLPPLDMRFADMDGDGRDDLVRIGWTGVMHIWLNKVPNL